MGDLQLSVTTDAVPWALRLYNTEHDTERLIPIDFFIDNKRLSRAPDGIKFVKNRPDKFTVYGSGRTILRFCFEGIKQFENACAREDGSIETAFLKTGKLLFVPLKGAIWHNAMWIPEKAQSDDFIIDLLPSIETNEFQAAIYAYYSNGVRDA
ncbi:MAG: hypothetical protein FWH33_00315 [Oscillospiraceae bacterium]|nr:hypothetical protein [Oscillospiraceae bacterium]